MTRTYEQLIPRAEREKLELALEMGQGYVLDLSDRTFNDFSMRDWASTQRLKAASSTGAARRKRSA